MTEQPERIDDDQQPGSDVDGTATGDPVAGAKISEQDLENAVEPDENSALEVEGPQQMHA